MTDISVERISEILRLVFDLLWFEPQGLYASEIMRYFQTSVALTEFENGQYNFAPYTPRYEVIIRVGTIPLVRAGWMEKTNKGRWLITEAGRKACKQYTNPEDFFRESVRLFQEWKDHEDSRLARLSADPYNIAAESAWDQIRHYIDSLNTDELRSVVSALLEALGCHIAWSATTDHKEYNELVDMMCYSDPLGVGSPRILVHIANKSQVSTIEGLSAFMNVLHPGEVGLYISFGGTTSALKEFTLKQTQSQIRLIDLEKFIELWIENLEKISVEERARFPLRPVYFLSNPDSF